MLTYNYLHAPILRQTSDIFGPNRGPRVIKTEERINKLHSDKAIYDKVAHCVIGMFSLQ